jgi:hydrogenase maturation protease
MLTIIGCGNPNRSDDGAGVAVVERLLARCAGKPPPGVRIFDAGTAGMDVMFKARGATELILVDASSSQSEPGSIFEVPGQFLEKVPEPGHSLHGFRWEHALHAGRLIYKGDFPERVAVYLIEQQTLELGVGLSAPVLSAVTRVVELISARLDAVAEGAAAEGPPHAPCVRIQNGSFYLDAKLYETYFGGRDSVAVLRRGEHIALMPLAPGSVGGSLAKVRNAGGDRVIHAPELLSALDLCDRTAYALSATWDPALAALTLPLPNPLNV